MLFINLNAMNLEDDGKLSYKFSGLNSRLKQLYKDGLYGEIGKLIRAIGDAAVYKPIFQEALRANLTALGGDDRRFLSVLLGQQYISGTDGDDDLNGNHADNFIYGAKGNDRLYGEGGDDILDGGEGDDVLEGGEGNDTYVFGKGYGADVIYDKYGDNVVEFKEGITSGDLSFKRSGAYGENLTIYIGDSKDSLTLKGIYEYGVSDHISGFKFSDGSFLSIGEINKEVYFKGADGDDNISGTQEGDKIYGGKGNDRLLGWDGDDILEGEEGSDTLDGDNGNDILIGGKGGDTLNGGAGNDILEGGAGNDNLGGAEGDDTYVFGRGDGEDTIYEHSGNDTIRFKDGITLKDIGGKINNNHSDIEIYIKGTNDSLTIRNAYDRYDAHSDNMIENFEFSDGTKLSFKEFEERILSRGTDDADCMYGSEKDDKIYSGAGDDDVLAYMGNDIVYGGEGNDNIRGDTGNDTLYGGEGKDKLFGDHDDDILEGGAGNDHLEGGSEDDTYIFSKGDGYDSIIEYHGNDTIKFKDGVKKQDLTFMLSDNDLSIRYGENDFITINNYALDASCQIEKIVLEDGNIITNDQINKIIQDINAYAKDNGITGISHDTMRNDANIMNLVMSGWSA